MAPRERRLRLVGEGGDGDPARKVWRLKMETSDNAIPMPVAGALRLFSAARSLFAVVGLAVVLVAAFPAAREGVLRQLLASSESWDEAEPAVTSAGTIQAGAAGAREQRAVSEFLAKRYKVAQDAAGNVVAAAYRAGGEWKVDPLLILAVVAVESRFNPIAESNLGAKGLMQVIPRFHTDKLAEHGGEDALLDPAVNNHFGARILREYLRRFGETETALQMYAGAFDEPNSAYAFKVLAERSRLEQTVRQARRASAA